MIGAEVDMGLRKGWMVLVVWICLLAGGCWDRKELDELAFALGVGVDYDPKQQQTKLISQIIRPGQMKSAESGGGSAGQGGQDAFFLVESQGKTVFEAVRKSSFQISRRINWTHSEVVIFGKGAVETGVNKFLDFFVRDPEPRPHQHILVADGRMEEIFKFRPNLEKASAQTLEGMMKNAVMTSEIYPVTLQEFVNDLMSYSKAATAPVVAVIGEGKDQKLQLVGTAVFKREKCVGKIDPKETRGMLWVIGKVKSGIFSVPSKDYGEVGIEIIQASSKIQPKLDGKELTVRVDVKAICNIGEQQGGEDVSKPEKLFRFQKKLESEIKKEIEKAIKRSREMKADIFGIGEAFHRKYPKQWKSLEPEWEQHFPKVKFSLNVKAKLELIGESLRPLHAY